MVEDVELGFNVNIRFPELVNIYRCSIGSETFIGPFVEIQCGVTIGDDCRIQSHSFICEMVTIGNHVFIGHGVMFCNDKDPPNGNYAEVAVHDYAVIGSGSVILPGVVIGEGAMIGAGAVVTKDVSSRAVVIGNPARSQGG